MYITEKLHSWITNIKEYPNGLTPKIASIVFWFLTSTIPDSLQPIKFLENINHTTSALLTQHVHVSTFRRTLTFLFGDRF